MLHPNSVATRLGATAVADITYVNTGQGWAYLSLLTDASSRAIVGYALYKTLETEGPLKALEMAMSFYEKYQHRHEHSYSSFRPGECPNIAQINM